MVYSIDRPELPPLPMPDRFRHEITFFMSIPGERGIPELPAGEYWVRLDEARNWFDEGVIYVVSPLDSENRTEIEISEDQERWLEWMIENQVQHVRLK